MALFFWLACLLFCCSFKFLERGLVCHNMQCVCAVYESVCVCVCLCISLCVCVPLKFTFSFASSHDFWPFTIIFCFFTLACGKLAMEIAY